MAKSIKYAIGVDIGGTNIKVGIVSDKGKLVKNISVKTEADGGPKKVIANIIKGVESILVKNKYKIQGIGIGCPGVVSINFSSPGYVILPNGELTVGVANKVTFEDEPCAPPSAKARFTILS